MSTQHIFLISFCSKGGCTIFTDIKPGGTHQSMWQILLMVWTNTPQMSQVCAELPRQCLHLRLWEHTLLVPLFTMDKHKMERRFMGHLTTTSILMTLISLWQFCWKSLWDGRKILTYHPFSICSLTTVLVKTWTATCLLCWHFWSKRKVLRKYVILVNFKKKWICLIHISHKALFSSIKMSHCNVFKVHLGGKLVSIQSQFLQQLNERNLKLK